MTHQDPSSQLARWTSALEAMTPAQLDAVGAILARHRAPPGQYPHMNAISHVLVEEVSILTSDAEPAVPAARVLLTKAADPAPLPPAARSSSPVRVLAGTEATPGPSLMAIAAEIAKRDGISRTAALRKARHDHPQAFEALQTIVPEAALEPEPASSEKRAAVTTFDALARKLRRDRGLTGTEALRAARRENPQAFAALQGG